MDSFVQPAYFGVFKGRVAGEGAHGLRHSLIVFIFGIGTPPCRDPSLCSAVLQVLSAEREGQAQPREFFDAHIPTKPSGNSAK